MLNYERVMAYDIAPIEQAFTARDTILYALGVGASLDPSNTRELRFTYERRLAMLPTMPVVLGRPGPWFKDPALEALLKELAGHNKGLCLVTSRIGLTDLAGLRGIKVEEKKLDNLSPVAGAALLKALGARGTSARVEASCSCC